jgi:6-phosphofructokinase 1
MSTIIRRPGPIYRVDYDKVPLDLVANSERTFPKEWIKDSLSDVTDDFINYARPLIGEDLVQVPMVNGLMRYASFKPIFADKKLKPYTPCGYRR